MVFDTDSVVRTHFATQSISGGLHVAIIMDGNGRWAEARGLPRSAGHVAGAETVERIVAAAAALPIERLTLFALSADNWNRPAGEIDAILELMRVWLTSKTEECVANHVRLSVIGRRDRLPSPLVAAIEHAECATADQSKLHVRLAVDYSARDAIVRAARRFNVQAALDGARDGFERTLAVTCHANDLPRDVDLLVRTGGEQRLSDFLLWECAYAELFFSPRSWPDFTAADLEAALVEFRGRNRRFGGLSA
ncbi:MAG: di-trans,poly-cis-decaprenylcistransferase [Planctomycetes bacterium]|nr:di-trans,poly-cis-decaprenylcistransferase [Planctomycetota bacterium]